MTAARKPGYSPAKLVFAVIAACCLIWGGIGFVMLHFVAKFW